MPLTDALRALIEQLASLADEMDNEAVTDTEDGNFSAAARCEVWASRVRSSGGAALAALPTGEGRCHCWLGEPGVTFGDSAKRESCPVHGDALNAPVREDAPGWPLPRREDWQP